MGTKPMPVECSRCHSIYSWKGRKSDSEDGRTFVLKCGTPGCKERKEFKLDDKWVPCDGLGDEQFLKGKWWQSIDIMSA